MIAQVICNNCNQIKINTSKLLTPITVVNTVLGRQPNKANANIRIALPLNRGCYTALASNIKISFDPITDEKCFIACLNHIYGMT